MLIPELFLLSPAIRYLFNIGYVDYFLIIVGLHLLIMPEPCDILRLDGRGSARQKKSCPYYNWNSIAF